jgi:hypothetical protein
VLQQRERLDEHVVVRQEPLARLQKPVEMGDGLFVTGVRPVGQGVYRGRVEEYQRRPFFSRSASASTSSCRSDTGARPR